MSRATLNFLIDVATFIVALGMAATGVLLRFVLPPGSGERRSVWDLTRHEWGGLHFWLAVVLGGLVLVHLALHWNWVCSFVARQFRAASSPPQPSSGLRRNLLGLAAVAVVALLVGGFVWAAQQAIVEREGPGRQERAGRAAVTDAAHAGERRQFRGGRGATAEPSSARAERNRDTAPEPAVAPEQAQSNMIIAYYFHRTMRCATCLSIEKQSREAIELAYGSELSSGRLEWHAVNIEEPGNEHFEKDFELQTQSLVLVESISDRVARWKLLPKVWELVEDPYGFQEYVVSEVALFIGGG